jgi:hypothetical protein
MIAHIELVARINKAVQTVMNRVILGAIPPTMSAIQLNVTKVVILKVGSSVTKSPTLAFLILATRMGRLVKFATLETVSAEQLRVPLVKYASLEFAILVSTLS